MANPEPLWASALREVVQKLAKNPKQISTLTSLGAAAVVAPLGGVLGPILVLIVAILVKIFAEVIATTLSSYLVLGNGKIILDLSTLKEGDVGKLKEFLDEEAVASGKKADDGRPQ